MTFFERVGVWFGDPQSDVDLELSGDQLVSVRRVAFVLLGLALGWWPLDPIVFAGKPHIIRGFAYYRGSVAILLCLLLALVTLSKSVAARPLRAFRNQVQPLSLALQAAQARPGQPVLR